ncbi:MAG: hypothetical protein MHMPM18_001252 [Marteilia pararefringens]
MLHKSRVPRVKSDPPINTHSQAQQYHHNPHPVRINNRVSNHKQIKTESAVATVKHSSQALRASATMSFSQPSLAPTFCVSEDLRKLRAQMSSPEANVAASPSTIAPNYDFDKNRVNSQPFPDTSEYLGKGVVESGSLYHQKQQEEHRFQTHDIATTAASDNCRTAPLPQNLIQDTPLIESINRTENMSLISEKGRNRIVTCNVTLYNNGKFECQLKRNSTVKSLFKLVTSYLKIWELDYFALKQNTNELNVIRWLDLDDTLSTYSHKDASNNYILKCCFVVKFYLIDPSMIEDDNTRYFYFSQVYSDISKLKIVVPIDIQPELYGLVLQSQLGDYIQDTDEQYFVNKSSYVLNSTPAICEKACEYHKKLVGLHPPQAEAKFLNLIKNCLGYSWISFSVYNDNHISMKMNLASYGIVITSKGQILDVYEWSNIHKLSLMKKSLKLHYFINSQFTTTISFYLNHIDEAESIYKYAKSYSKFYCERYYPQRKISNSTKMSLSRSRSFVISESQGKRNSINRSTHSAFNSSMSFHDPMSLIRAPDNDMVYNTCHSHLDNLGSTYEYFELEIFSFM